MLTPWDALTMQLREWRDVLCRKLDRLLIAVSERFGDWPGGAR